MNHSAEAHAPVRHVISDTAYLDALQNYLSGAGEPALQRAYEIGRIALDNSVGLMAIAHLHHVSLQAILSQEVASQRYSQILDGAAQFFTECIAPYEMTYKGFREANRALRHFNEVFEQEAKRIAHVLHDESGQLLVAVYIALQNLSREIPAAQGHVDSVIRLLDQIEIQMRHIAHELMPAMLHELGLVPALRFLSEGMARRTQLQIHVDELPGQRLPKPIESTLYQVAKEALHNVVKHAQASEVTIRFQRIPTAVFCFIEDDGVGFDATENVILDGERGFGLIGMYERLNVVRGQLQIDSSRGEGTRLVIFVPVEN